MAKRKQTNIIKDAEAGSADAQYSLGGCYFSGDGVERSYEKAAYWFEKAAEQGDVRAQRMIGLLYNSGVGVERSIEKAIFWFAKATEQGNVDSKYYLAICYRRQGTEESYKKAFELFAAFAEEGYSVAQAALAALYLKGLGVPQSYEKAAYWFEKAADQGDTDSQQELAKLYRSGQGVPQSYEKAVELFEASFHGAKQDEKDILREGRPESAYYLGNCYHLGLGVTRNLYRAKDYYQKAIEGGYNCRYALEIAERDLALERYYQEALKAIPHQAKNREQNARKEAKLLYAKEVGRSGAQKYVQDLVKKGLNGTDRKHAIEKDLQKEFGAFWDGGLKKQAKKAMISALFDYSTRVEMGPEEYVDLDFSPVINQLSKAFETELREYFFVGYLRYLKSEGVPPSEIEKYSINRESPLLWQPQEGGEQAYRKEEDFSFSLGSLYYVLASRERSEAEDYGLFSRRVMEDSRSERVLDPHVLAYAKSLFSDNAFFEGNREQEIVNYLVDLATDTKTIKDFRNPAAHAEIMSYDQAAITANYLVMIHKMIYHFLEKINPKYLGEDGFRPEE